MRDELGFVVIEYRQTGGYPYIVVDTIYDRREEARDVRDNLRDETTRIGRRDTYHVARLVLDEETSDGH